MADFKVYLIPSIILFVIVYSATVYYVNKKWITDKSGLGWALIVNFVPIIGLAMFFVLRPDKRVRLKERDRH